MKKLPNHILIGTIFISLLSVFLFSVNKIFSAADHVVISEIQISGATANDEFVELYNPTDAAVNLEDWRLTRKTSSGSQSNLASSISGIIPANGYFLIAHPNYDGMVTEDFLYTATSSGISYNNTVVLYSDAGTTVVDKVGMGTAIDVETASVDYPGTDQSIERKALSTSTATSMDSGGTDEFLGNGEDTNNNSADFILKEIPDPQNSDSTPEIPSIPSPSPTVSPTPEPTPTIEPTPTQEPTPIPTTEPTPIPTLIPSPSPIPTQPPKNVYWNMPLSRTMCYLNYKEIKFAFFTIRFPYVVCEKY